MILELVGSLFIIIVVYVLKQFLVLVPARKAGVVEKMGEFARLLTPGIHFVMFPLEQLRSVRWSYVGQNNRLVTRSETMVSLDAQQLDIPVVQCLSRDQIRVSIDGTVMYQVTNLKQAVYEMSDVLNYFYQCVNQAVRNTVSETEMVDLNGRDRELGVRIAAYVNRMTAKTAEHGELGIACQSFIVQSVKVDEKILEANQKIFAAKRQQEMMISQKKAEHETVMWSLKMQEEKEQSERQLVLLQKRAELDLQLLSEKNDAERLKLQLSVLKEQGFSPEQILEYRRIEALKSINSQCSTRMIYAPLDFWTKGGSNQKLVEPGN